MMEVQRALDDLAEVRARLAATQRFRGLSGWAAIGSGGVAVACGAAQFALDPFPKTALDGAHFVALWAVCLALALALNYGAIGVWYARHWSSRSRIELRTVGLAIVPAIVVGGILTAALVIRGDYDVLPATWMLAYAVGLFASRALVPPAVVYVAVFFAALGAAFGLFPSAVSLAWWVMPLGFGIGQTAIGAIVLRSEQETTGAR
jgi:hypothetical protein